MTSDQIIADLDRYSDYAQAYGYAISALITAELKLKRIAELADKALKENGG